MATTFNLNTSEQQLQQLLATLPAGGAMKAEPSAGMMMGLTAADQQRAGDTSQDEGEEDEEEDDEDDLDEDPVTTKVALGHHEDPDDMKNGSVVNGQPFSMPSYYPGYPGMPGMGMMGMPGAMPPGFAAQVGGWVVLMGGLHFLKNPGFGGCGCRAAGCGLRYPA